MPPTKITIQADIQAGINKVWDYYTNPSHIVHWNFASPDWHCPDAENELKVGGKYWTRMEARDGSFGFDFEAIYDAIIPLKGFTYTMPDHRQVTVEMEPAGDHTKITVVFDAENQNPIELQRGGWQSILNNFAKYTESN